MFISRGEFIAFCDAYPELDVAAEFNEIRNYLRWNRQSRPAADGLPGFVQRWLMRARQKKVEGETPWQREMRERREMARWYLQTHNLGPEDFGLKAM